MRQPLLDYEERALREWLGARGFPAFHARQVLGWVLRRRAEAFAVMTDLPLRLRDALDESFVVFGTRELHRAEASDSTTKLILACQDGRTIESVLMREERRRTVCVSSQVGCGMGCVFCASGLNGLERNLTSAEILEQVLRLRNLLPAEDALTNLVVMGMGESLANLDNLILALDRICSAEGLGLSQRRVTISTVGLPAKMRKLAEMDRQYHLAVSLHAATPELRDRLVPVNERVGLDAVLDAADDYFRKTGRRVTYEYVMLGGVNDRAEDASALARLLRHRHAHVNLIPYNPVDELAFRRPGAVEVRRMVAVLRSAGIAVTVRQTRGRDIDAACGQLRRRAADRVETVQKREPAEPRVVLECR